MAVELISKIKPKNNGTFPLVDAEDVAMPDGTRLSDFKGGVTSVNGQTGDVTITVDDALYQDSTNPVENRVVALAIADFEQMVDQCTELVNDFNNDLGDHGRRISALEQSGGTSITVDSEFSETSENPVQNKVITAAMGEAIGALQTIVGTIPTDDHINSLIDTKLGVIENGTY